MTEGLTPGPLVSLLKIGHLHPPRQRRGRYAGGTGGIVEVSVREQGRDGLLLFAPELGAVSDGWFHFSASWRSGLVLGRPDRFAAHLP